MEGEKEQFISLKKAAKVSGYSPDYLGYLIRIKKIKGKKIYSNISWQTNLEEIIRYSKKIKKSSDIQAPYFSKKKYISLRKAAKISGYSSDYLGDLIRKEKIKGKKFYSGVSWLINEEAVKKYQERKINTQIQEEVTFNFSPYLNLIIPQKGNRIFGFGWRLALSTFVILFLITGSTPVKFLQSSIGTIFAEEEKIVNFYSTVSTGDWQNSQNVQSLPEVESLGTIDSFSEANSAVYKGGPLTLVAENFQPNFDINLDERQIESAKVKISFAIGEKESDILIQQEKTGGELEDNSSSPEGKVGFWNKIKNFFKTLANRTINLVKASLIKIVSIAEAEEETNDAEQETTDEQQETGGEDTITNIQDTNEEETEEIEETGETEEVKEETEKETEKDGGETGDEQTEIENQESEEEEEEEKEPMTTEILGSEVKGTDEDISGTPPEDTLPNIDTRIIIWYSLEGQNWQELDTISDYPLSNALNNGYFEYDISFLKNWEDIKNLKIKFEGVIGGETNVVAYLDSIWVETNYREQETEEQDTTIKIQNTNGEEETTTTETMTTKEEATTSDEGIIEEESEKEVKEKEELEEQKQEEEKGIKKLSKKDSFRANEKPGFTFKYKKVYDKFLALNKETDITFDLTTTTTATTTVATTTIATTTIATTTATTSVNITTSTSVTNTTSSEDSYLTESDNSTTTSSTDTTATTSCSCSSTTLDNNSSVDSSSTDSASTTLFESQILGTLVPELFSSSSPTTTIPIVDSSSSLPILDISTSTPTSTLGDSTSTNLISPDFETSSSTNVTSSTSSDINKTSLENIWEGIDVNLEIKGPKGNNADIDYNIFFEENGEFSIEFDKPSQFRPGLYKLIVTIEDNSTGLLEVQEFEQDFEWGVLAINVNKSIYLPNEIAYLQMAVLTDKGDTVCYANLELRIKDQESGIETILSTQDGTIQYSGECGANNVTDVPDYFAYYQIGETGTYQMKLTNLNNGYEIEDSFEVRDYVPFDVERIGPTRIYPPADYEMRMKIKANEDFIGQVIESTPANFEIIGADQSQISIQNNTKEIAWDVDWKAGEEYEFSYQFDAPDISPYLYLSGPLGIGNFEEIRQWQIASDAYTVEYQNQATSTASDVEITISAPSGFSAGDLFIAVVIKDDDPAIVLPTGSTWTIIQEGTGADPQSYVSVSYRIAVAGDTNWTWTGDTETWYGVILRYTGQASSDFIHASGKADGDSTTPTAPDVSYINLATGSLTLQIFGSDDVETSYITPASLTERYNGISPTPGGCGGAGGDKAVSGSGSTGIAEFTQIAAEEWIAVTVVVEAEEPGIDISGNVYINEGQTTTSDTSTIALAINSTKATTTSISNGSYEFINQPIYSDDIVTVFWDTGAGGDKAVTVAKEITASTSDFHLYKDRVIIRQEGDNAVTIADLDKYDYGQDTDILFTASSTPATLTASSTSEFFIWPGDTFEAGPVAGTVSLHDVDIRGTFTATSTQTISVSGSWFASSSATFNPATSNVEFTGSGTINNATSVTFYDLTFGDGSPGTTTAISTATTTISNVLTIASSQTLSAGTNIWELSDYGTPFIKNGVFNCETSTFKYTSNGNTYITATDYYNLELVRGG